jgi:hypothetical protein
MSDAGPSLRMHAVVIDCPEFAPLIAFWSAALGYVEWFAPFDQFAGIKPPEGSGGLPIIFQRVPEPKVVKNRVHLDYEADAMEAEVDRLVGLGGRSIRVVEMGPTMRWTIVADPAGNEFCVVQA